jgi:Flp pilus assembly protein TadG
MIQKMLRSHSGTSVVEFAVLAPVIVFLLMGVIEVGRYMFFGVLASHAARAGVQYGTRNLTTAMDASVSGPGTTGAALQDGQSLPQLSARSWISCTLNGQPSTCPSTTANYVPSGLIYYVEVQVTGTFTSLMQYPGIPHSLPVTATAIMPVGNQ